MDRTEMDQLTQRIIGAAQRVHRTLAPGFLERIYEGALAIELAADGLSADCQKEVKVRYRGHVVGNYVADMLVENTVLVEVKAVENLGVAHRAQCINYLRAIDLRVGLLLNFGRPSLEVRRIANRF